MSEFDDLIAEERRAREAAAQADSPSTPAMPSTEDLSRAVSEAISSIRPPEFATETATELVEGASEFDTLLGEIRRAEGVTAPTVPSRRFQRVFQTTTTDNTRSQEPSFMVDDEPGLITRSIERLFGTDVDDPLALERLGAVAVGSIVGAKAGASAGLPLGPAGAAAGGAIGGVAGAAAGATLPEGTLEAMEMFGLLPSGVREERGLSEGELRRVVAGEALLEAEFFGAATATRLLSRAFGRSASGLTKETDEIAERAAQQGIDLAPFQLGKRPLGSGIVNVLGRFPIFGSFARKTSLAAERAFLDVMEDAPERIAPLVSDNEIARNAYREFKHLYDETSEFFSNSYDALFLEAKRLGISVAPKDASEAVSATVKRITESAPSKTVRKTKGNAVTSFETVEEVVKGSPAHAGQYARDFLETEMRGLTDQSLGQMDELLTKVDQAVASAPKEIRKQVFQLLVPVKGALKSDVLRHMKGEGAEDMADQLARLDADFSETMLRLFEHSTAKRVSRVRRQGMKSMVRQSEEATQFPIDRLAEVLVDLKSPQAIDELSRMVSPETFGKVGAATLAKAIERSVTVDTAGNTLLRPDRFAEMLGLGAKPTAKGEAVERLLRGTGMTRESLEALHQTMRVLKDSKIPSVSTFIARRAGIGGFKAVTRGMLPFVATAGLGVAGSLVHALAILGGVKSLVASVSDPRNARALSKVMDKELPTVLKRASYLQLLRGAVTAMGQDDPSRHPADVAVGEWDEAQKRVFDFGQEMFDAVKDKFSDEGK